MNLICATMTKQTNKPTKLTSTISLERHLLPKEKKKKQTQYRSRWHLAYSYVLGEPYQMTTNIPVQDTLVLKNRLVLLKFWKLEAQT